MKNLFRAFFACMALAACTTTETSNKICTDLTGEWNIVEANGISTDSAQIRPYILFTDSGTVNGNASVNTFFGRYTTSGDTLSLYEMGATMMMGEDMEVETAVMEALGKTVTFKLENSTLSVKDANGNSVMTLERK